MVDDAGEGPRGREDRVPADVDVLVEDALIDGDLPAPRGTARAAFAHPVFRRVYFGALLSNMGTWMQNVVLGAFVYQQTGSATWVALISLAELGPLLFLSLAGGALADRFDRRSVLIIVSFEQLVFSFALAVLVLAPRPNMGMLLVLVLATGVGRAIYAPAYGALIPTLVAPEEIAGAISLNSANMNLSRVIGPAIGGVLFAGVGAAWVFAGNAVTFLFIIVALWTVQLERPIVDRSQSRFQRLLGGFRVARHDRVVGRCLVTMVGFSFFCLPIAVLMPVLAKGNLGIDEQSVAYGLLYASFGLGAVTGALSIGTFLARRDLALLARLGLIGYAGALVAFALIRLPAPAYPVAFAVGFFYFMVVTSLSTVLQERLDDAVRGRVMALWVMAFGGTVPIGAMVVGPLSDVVGITLVLLVGAGVSAALWFVADLSEAS